MVVATTKRAPEDMDWMTLASAINEGECILMLGPNAVRIGPAGKTKPITEGFAKQLRSIVGGRRARHENYFEVGQEFLLTHRYPALRAQAESYFRKKHKLHRGPLERLADLPFRLIVTTVPGGEIEGVLKDRGKSPRTDYFDFTKARGPRLLQSSTESPLVFHLYGSIEDPASLVLSENDLLDFLVGVISKGPDLPEQIRTEFNEPKKTFLFLGFEFSHWCLRILLHTLHQPRPESGWYALEYFDRSWTKTAIKKAKQFFQRGHHIHFFDMDLDEFTLELHVRCKRGLKTPKPEAWKMELPASAPTVFISHASEDLGAAKWLAANLAEAGVRPWLDATDLLPGHRWADALQQVIAKADYFLVLQSRNLLAKKVGWVHLELKHALKRQELLTTQLQVGPDGGLQPAPVFIIPTRIDDCEHLFDLEGIQCADLWEDGALAAVIEAIVKDHANLTDGKGVPQPSGVV